jgi:DNA-binding LacI/PurR family transcriptional regulator
MPTVIDVARRAGVSVSTVSYALNGTRPISEETRQRIMMAVEELGYKPHALARGLASKRSRILALLFPTSERGLGFTEFEFVTSAANAAKDSEYNLVLWSYDMHDLADLRQLTRQGLVDGVVVMEVHETDERIEMLREIGFPFSMIGRCANAPGISYVDIDFKQTVRAAIDYLMELGHTHIAFLNQSEAAFKAGYGPVVRTQAGFEQAMHASGLESVSVFCRAEPQAGYEMFSSLLADHPDLTALITMNERAVPGVVHAIANRGWSIPDDFSLVVVVSSARMAEMMFPPLTAMEAMTAEMGRLGVELLIQQLEGQAEETRQVLLPCRLVERGSSGSCRRNSAAPGR